MSQKPQVRIVKRGRPDDSKEPQAERAPTEKETRRGTRAVAENVTSWVEEFRQRRRKDDGRSFASLFAQSA